MKGVMELWNVTPEKLPYILALMGDKSDNSNENLSIKNI